MTRPGTVEKRSKEMPITRIRTCRLIALIRNILVVSVVFSLAVPGAGCARKPADSVQEKIQSMLEEKYQAYKSEAGLPENAGILVYLETPEGKYTAAAGLPAGADETWHYRVASVSKTFTAAAIMLLDQQGKLNIDDVLTDTIPGTSEPYLANSPNYNIPFKEQITIRQLLSHQAGIFDVFNNPVPEDSPYPYAGQTYAMYVGNDLNEPDHQFTADELAGVISGNQLYFTPPGTEYHYSDTGYTLLAKIVERVSLMSFDRFISEYFLTPIELVQTSVVWNGDDITIPSPYLTGYVSGGDEFFEMVEDNMSGQVGPGSVISTPADIAHWMRTLLSGRGPLNQQQIEQMISVPEKNTTYALGIGNTEIGAGHSGAHPGYVNLVVYNPDDDVSVAVVTPFIDYSRLNGHLNLLIEAGKAAREIAGYSGVWTHR